jgi:subtilisin
LLKGKAKWLGAFVLSVSLMSSAFSVSAGAGDSSPQEEIRVLIKTDQALKGSLKKDFGVRHDFSEEGFTTTVTPKQLENLKKMKSVEVTEVNKVQLEWFQEAGDVSALATVPSDQTPWGIEAIYNNSAITSTSGGAGIRVAVLDTGVYTNHIDLEGQTEQCKDFTQSGAPIVNGTCNDGNGHGTHVAGTILAHGGYDGLGIYGVAPDAKLWAYKVLLDSGSGYSDDIATAIRHAADEGTRLGVKVIISMSLGSSTKDTLISSAVDYAYSKGALVVAAAGNSGYNPNTINYPGALVNAVAVAALENVISNGNYRVADFSSRGNPATAGDYVIQERDVEVSAPGRNVESTWNDGNYRTISGTSMATPHISGLAAKIWAAHPTWTNANVRAELQNRAKTNDIKGGYYAGTGDDIASGFGFPRVAAGDQ